MLLTASEIKLEDGQYVNALDENGERIALTHSKAGLRNWFKASEWEMDEVAAELFMSVDELYEKAVGRPFMFYGEYGVGSTCWIDLDIDSKLNMDPKYVIYGDENGDKE